MGSEWKEKAFGELFRVKHGFAFKGEHFADKPTKHLLTTPGNFAIGGGFLNAKPKFYDGPVPEDYILKGGDVVVTMTDLSKASDTLGNAAIIPEDENVWLHNQRVGLLEFHDDEAVDAQFICYLLRSNDYRSWIVGSATGTTVKHTSPSRITEFSCPLPPLPEQKAIAHILGTLDDKIELNRRMNATLEGMAQALFKSWFVDFDPVIDNALAAGNPIPDELAPRAEVRKQALASSGEPSRTNGTTQQGSVNHPTLSDPKSLFPDAFQFTEELGWIPEGWESVNLGSVTTKFATGLNPRKNFVLGEGDNFYVTIKNMGAEGVVLDERCDKVTNEALRRINARSDLRAGDMLFSGIGTIGRVHYIDQTPLDWNISESVFTIRGENSKISPNYLYRLLRGHDMQEYAQAMASGSVQKGIRMSALKDYLFVLPPKEVMNLAEENLSALLTKWKANISENNKLSKLRDTLLPKLISGELAV